MLEYDYYFRAAWGGELPSTWLDELSFGHNINSAKAFAIAKSIEDGWCEVVTVALPMGGNELPVGAIVFEHGQQVHAEGLTS